MKIKSHNISFGINTLLLDAIGIQEHKPIRYLLNLTLHGEIDPEASYTSMEAVGNQFDSN